MRIEVSASHWQCGFSFRGCGHELRPCALNLWFMKVTRMELGFGLAGLIFSVCYAACGPNVTLAKNY